MNSPIATLTWEIWRKGRRFAWFALGSLALCSLLNLIVLDKLHASVEELGIFSNLFGFLMVWSFLFLMGIFNYTESNSTRDWNGFPYRLFVLPVRTWQFVALPMLLGVASVELFYFAWVKLVWTHHPIAMPEWFAVVLGAYMIFYQTTLWSMAGFRLMRVVVLAVGGVSSILVASLPFLGRGDVSPWFSERRLIALVSGMALLAVIIALTAVSKQRCGGGHRKNWIITLLSAIGDALPRRTADFSSASAAQFWFEWRRAGFLLPVFTGLFFLSAGPASWFLRADANFTLKMLCWTLALPLALSLAIGRGFIKPEFWSLNLSMPSFLAVKPIPAGEFIIAKMKVAAVSVILSWLLVVAFIAAWLSGWANTKELQFQLFMFRQLYPHAWLAILALSLCGLLALSWRFMVNGFWVGLSGKRSRYIMSNAVGVLVPVILLLACAIWHDAVDVEIKYHPEKVKSIMPKLFGWFLALALIAKVWLAVFSWKNVNDRRARQYLLLWVGTTICFVGLAVLAWLPMDPYRFGHLFVLAALLLVPLGRLGLAPMALAGNRHGSGSAFQPNVPVKKKWITGAFVFSGVAVALAIDPGHFVFRYVDAGGHTVRMLLKGQGKPTVIFENGRRGSEGSSLEDWVKVQPAVSQFTKTIAYDQSGAGLSALGPRPHDGLQNARELHTALQNAGAAPPYILVGHSFGGPFIRVFAGLYPKEVAGLVLVDPTQEEFINRPGNKDHEEMPDEDWQEIQASLTQAHESRVPAGIPVVLFTGVGRRELPGFMTEKEKEKFKTVRQLWLKFHSQWLDTVPNSQHIIVDCGHGIPFEKPDMVINAIRQMVDQIRTNQPPASSRIGASQEPVPIKPSP